MLYTIVSLDDIFYTPPKVRACCQAGIHCYLELSDGKITAVKSTDPADYLKFQVGQGYEHAE